MRTPKQFTKKKTGKDVATLSIKGKEKKLFGCPKCGYGFLPFDKFPEGIEKCPECNTKLNWDATKISRDFFY